MALFKYFKHTVNSVNEEVKKAARKDGKRHYQKLSMEEKATI
jgi:hypothetical protein